MESVFLYIWILLTNIKCILNFYVDSTFIKHLIFGFYMPTCHVSLDSVLNF